MSRTQFGIISSEVLVTSTDVTILDIRTRAEYETGHIVGAVNVPFEMPFSAWTTMQDDLLMSLPEKAAVLQTIGNCGIDADSRVVVVTQGDDDPPYSLANAARVATILIYAGVNNVAILDGGHAKSVADGKPLTTEVPEVTAVSYTAPFAEEMFVSMADVYAQISQDSDVLLLDARDTDVYEGDVLEPFADKPGHIPGAKSLPAPSLWNEDGTYKSLDALAEIATAVTGNNKGQEIIMYCGVGGYASSWWYVLTQILGYENVKIFDGSAQEWAKHYDMVLD